MNETTDTTDIVIATCNRYEIFKRSLVYLFERTTSPYRLHLIDDASEEANADLIEYLAAKGRVESVKIRSTRQGIPANLRSILEITKSDPVVFSDDDILCPKLEPDWLERGLEVMELYKKIGLLALNNPQAWVGYNKRQAGKQVRAITAEDGEIVEPITLCRNVGGTYLFIRRAVLEKCAPPDGIGSPIHYLCKCAADRGWKIGFLSKVYCQHIGEVSVRSGKRLHRELSQVEPINELTLEPPKRYQCS